MAAHGPSGEPGTSADSGDSRVYLVCDRCGLIHDAVHLDPDTIVERCVRCGSDAAWAFPNADKARELSTQINGCNPDASWGT